MSAPPAGSGSLLPRAYLAIERLEAQLQAAQQARNEPVAVIGLACRFPGGCDDGESFWRLLRAGRDAVGEVPGERWDVDAFYDPDPDAPGKMYTRRGAFLAAVDGFDAAFFGISPREAASLDPQQRLLLEVSWEALENAGLAADRLGRSRTGAFVGLMSVDYVRRLTASDAYTATGNDFSFAAGRLSYVLGLQGPCMTIATACSSSLVAVHLACQSLRAGECGLALAGGASLMLSPDTMVSLCRLRALAPDGRCKTFAAAADGYGRGEGCGMVVLKRLSDALAAGDPVLAVLRGSAVNHDGPSGGLTIPSGPAQEAVIREALARAAVEPWQVDYLEAHGTGTALGDPIEVHAAAAVLGPGRPAERPLRLGSLKANLGHMEAAAGIGGLIKCVLALGHGEVPPHPHVGRLNPHVAWDELPVAIPAAPMPWPAVAGRRLAGVSSFSLSGVNAHVVVEQAPPPAPVPLPQSDRPYHLLTLSARDEPALRQAAARYARRLREPGAALPDVAWSAGVGRARFACRLAVVAAAAAEAAAALDAHASGGPATAPAAVAAARVDPRGRPRLAFLCTGQGSEYPGMGRQLFASQPVFRRALERCDQLLRPWLGGELGATPLLTLLFTSPAATLARTANSQPALFSLGWALLELWRSWGVEPDVLLGQGPGELAAAAAAGVLGLEDALALAAERGRLLQGLAAGGPCEAALDAGGASEAALDAFAAAAGRARLAPPARPLVSSLSGKLGGPEMAEPAWWRRQLCRPVRLADSLPALRELGVTAWLEIGPAPSLLARARRGAAGGLWLPSLRCGRDEDRTILASLAALSVHGFEVDWTGFEGGRARRLAALPTYPFQRRRHWLEAVAAPAAAVAPPPAHPLLGSRLASPLAAAQFEGRLHAGRPAFLGDHRVLGHAVLPAAAYLEMGLAAAAARLDGDLVLEDVTFREPLVLSDQGQRLVHTIVTPASGGGCSLQVFSRAGGEDEDGWTLHATAHARSAVAAAGGAGPVAPAEAPALAIDGLRRRCPEPLDVQRHLDAQQARGIDYGPCFRGLAGWWRGDGEALAEVVLPPALATEAAAYRFHPALLDACLQALAGALGETGDPGAPWLPFAVESWRCHGRPGERVWCHARLRQPEAPAAAEALAGDLWIHGERGEPLARIEGLRLKRSTPDAFLRAAGLDPGSWLYEIAWRRSPLRAPGLPASFIPEPAEVAARLVPLAGEIGRRGELAHYRRLLPELEAAATALAVAALGRLGWAGAWRDAAAGLTAGELAGRLGVAPQHLRLWRRLLETLAEDGLLRRQGEVWEAAPLPLVPRPAARLEALRQSFPAASEPELLLRCGARLAEVLRGEVEPLRLIFAAEGAAAGGVYGESPFARAINELAGRAVEALVAELPAGRLLRVLEVGAGTGGTTGAVLASLPADRSEYLFTDVSPLFLGQAAQRFERPGFSCRLLDLELDPEAQGLEAGSCDLVVAANVLHGTADLRRSLAHVRRLLAPGGALLLIEGTARQRWLDLVFGLTPGWWRFADADLRPDHPLLSRRRWLDLLEEAGFAAAAVPPEAPQAAAGPGAAADVETTEAAAQALIVARAGAGGGAGRAAAAAGGGETPRRRGERGLWLVLGRAAGLGRELGARLEEWGARCRLVEELPDLAAPPAPGPPAPDPCERELAAAADADLAGIVHLGSLATTPPGEITAETLRRDVRRSVGSALRLVQALAGRGASPRLWLVTRGVHAVPGDHGPRAVAGAPLWGLGQVVTLEHPELACARVDLDPEATPAEAAAVLFAEIVAAAGEDQVALRRRGRYVPRLVPAAVPAGVEQAAGGGETTWRLQLERPGILDSLRWRPEPRRPPGPGEVEIQVLACGLNFRDVMSALDVLPGAANVQGAECAGRVAAVGPGTVGLAPGAPVVAIAFGAFGDRALADARLVVPMPVGLSFEQAAGLPIAMLTAHFALREIAGLGRGERVLIHAAAGGVGHAALWLARLAGAEVFATAGTPAKRRHLAALGVPHCLDSRSLSFLDEVRERTGGRGVDVVLNCLAREFIPASLAATAHGGRFVEIGKVGTWSPRQVAELRPDVAYTVYDLLAQIAASPAVVGAALARLAGEVAAGDLAALPVQAFPAAETVEAFRCMQQARHVGKIVVTPPPVAGGPFAPRERATYLITGGLGGVGLRLAGWLAQRGARHLVLAGRSGPSPAAREAIDRLTAGGVHVRAVRADVADGEQVAALLAEIRAELPPLAGIFHAAGVLADGVLQQQSWERFAQVLAPKVEGAWNLHAGTAGADPPLDAFVLFSSAAAVLGSAGQANHAAANAFLDALAHHRRALGLAALAVNWGAWSEVGAAAERGAGKRASDRGLGEIAPARGLAALATALAQPAPRVAVLPIDWPRFLRPFPPGAEPALLREMARQVRRGAAAPAAGAAAAAGAPGAEELRRELAAAAAGERRGVLARFLRRQVAKVLGLDGGQAIDGRQPLAELGLDSLMAVELRNVIGLAVGSPLPATLLFDQPTLEALADYLAREVLGLPAGSGAAAAAGTAPAAAGEADAAAAAAAVEQLSEHELDGVLAEFAQRYGEPEE
jgi:acyl transferase domain-containing protein